jgi:hypothetical protein
MVRHAHFGILRGDSGNQLGSIGVPGNDCPPTRFPGAKRLFAKHKGDAAFLTDATVAGNAVLIQDWPNVAAEIHGPATGTCDCRRQDQANRQAQHDPRSARTHARPQRSARSAGRPGPRIRFRRKSAKHIRVSFYSGRKLKPFPQTAKSVYLSLGTTMGGSRTSGISRFARDLRFSMCRGS